MIKRILSYSMVALTCSCSGSMSSGNSTGEGTGSAVAASAAKGTITCTIDGKARTFDVQQGFFEISLDPNAKGGNDGLELLDGNSKKEGFQFEIKKSGRTRIKADATGDLNCIINYYNAAGVTYTGEDVTITVTGYDGSRLSGTFSGKLVRYGGGSGSPEQIQITDGKFDLRKR